LQRTNLDSKILHLESTLQIASLNSGSNGNCYYVGNEDDAVLVDVGLSCKETERRMKRLGLDIQKVKAIFVSHEHIDHVRGLAGLAEKFSLPIYINDKTKAGCYHLTHHHTISFTANEAVSIGSLRVVGFSKMHDAADAHSFTISYNYKTVGVFTDIGTVCDNLIYHFKTCHAAFLEANYDDDLLENGKYPTFLKDRIRGEHGHLSNAQALDLFVNHKPSFMSHLLLAHLSKDNNDIALVQKIFEEKANGTKIIVASRYEESKLYTLADTAINANAPLQKKKLKSSTQIAMF
jgi:phosphoribosyl 1,2-cyclic phosphodiesterase